MQRDALQKLIQWKNSRGRKPLILKGARQTGKTWLMKEFGRLYYKDTIYINFENEQRFRSLFQNDFNVSRIISTNHRVLQEPRQSEKHAGSHDFERRAHWFLLA